MKQPRRPLLLLTLAVAAAHAWLLAGVTAREQPPVAQRAPQVFATRTVAAPTPAPTVGAFAAKPAAARSAKPPAQRRTPPAVPRKPSATSKPAVVLSQRAPPSPPPTPVWQMPSSAELLALGATEARQEQTALPGEEPAAPTDTDGADQAPPPDPAFAELNAPAITPAQTPPTDPPAAQAGTGANASPATDAPPSTAALPVPVKLAASRRLDFEVNGKAKGLSYSASAELLWEHDATSYRAHQEVKVLFLGSRSQTSVGSVTEAGLQPKRFGDRARSERAAHFDFVAGQVTFSANTPPAPIEAGAQDRLSAFLQLGAMLAAAPERYPAGTDISMTTVSARGADVWTFAVQAEETLHLPLGDMAAVPLTRLPRREYDQKAQLWLAPSLGYLPARIRITEANGDFVELNLRSAEAP